MLSTHPFINLPSAHPFMIIFTFTPTPVVCFTLPIHPRYHIFNIYHIRGWNWGKRHGSITKIRHIFESGTVVSWFGYVILSERNTITSKHIPTLISSIIPSDNTGDSADGWAGLMPELSVADAKFVLPSATDRPISINGGYEMPC